MSEVSVASDRFWREINTDIAGSLSDEQRGEIERVLELSSVPGGRELSDLRLSCKWFFVRLVWGPEKRSPDRIKHEQKTHPAMARRNAPMLASLLVGYTLLSYAAALGISAALFAYFIS